MAEADEANVLEIVDREGPISAQEVADILGCTRRAADYRLRQLHAEGKLEPASTAPVLLWRRARDAGDRNG